MKTLTRNDYRLKFHGWDEGAGCRVWYFDGPVVIKVIEDSEKETTLDAFQRLDKLLVRIEYGEAPVSSLQPTCGGYSSNGSIPNLSETFKSLVAKMDDRDDIYS